MPLAHETLARIHESVGTTLGEKYRLERLLGVGATAAVYEAESEDGARFAVKVLHSELARLEPVRTRFLREGYAANRVQHPGVVRVLGHDDGAKGGPVYLVMDLLRGETVDEWRARSGGRLALADTLDIAGRVLQVLVAAHGRAVIHRDIKPANLFLTTGGELKVLDFGIARLLDGAGATGSGQILGTPAFMSPEQASGLVGQVDARTDIWSVGAVMFMLLTGEPVHRASQPAEQLLCAATQPARSIRTVAPSLPRGVVGLVEQALAFDRRKRWQSAAAMRAALIRASS